MQRLLRTFVLLCGFAPAAGALPLTLGPRIGSSIPDLRGGGGNDFSRDYSSRIAPYFGVFAEIELTNQFSLQPEIDFAPQGGKRNGMQPLINDFPGLPPGTTVYANFENVAKLDYIEIPLLAKLRLGKARRFFVDLGPHVGYLFSAKSVTGGSSGLYFDAQGRQPVTDETGQPMAANFDATTETRNDLRHFSFGFQGGLGIVQELGRGEIYLDGRAGIGLTYIQKNTATDGSSRTGVLVVALGYAYHL